MTTKFYLLILLVSLLETLAMFLLKKGSTLKNDTFSFSGVALYALIGFIFLKTLKFRGLAMASVWWQIMTIITVTAISIFYFKEKLKRRHLVGIVLTMIALYLLRD